MRVIIAGGRSYKFTRDDVAWLDELNKRYTFLRVYSGCAPGADNEGEIWARSRGIRIEYFPADWKLHGLAAGPLRNAQMAENADAVALFPGGRGSASMKREAQKRGLTVWERQASPPPAPTPATPPSEP